MSLDSALRSSRKAASRKRIDEAVTALPTPSSKRSPSLNEKKQTYKQQGHGFLHCVHDISYFRPCSSCKRSEQDANMRLYRFLQRNGIA